MLIELGRLCVASVALILGFAAIGKLIRRREFRATLLRIPYSGPKASALASWGIPLSELASAVGLVCGFRPAGVAATGLFVSFIAISILAMRKRVEVPCNCLGFGGRALSWGTVLRNVILIGLTLPAFGIASPMLDLDLLLAAGGGILIVASIIELVGHRKAIERLRLRLN